MDEKVYNQCKRVVKLWERSFRKEKGRIPSKWDFHEARKDVRDAYRTYVQMKTAQLEIDIGDIFGDDENDDSSLQYSEISQIIATPTSGGGDTAPNDSVCDENEPVFNRINEEAWAVAAVEAPKADKKETPKPIVRMKSNRKFTLRNPRKPLTKTGSSNLSQTSTSSILSQSGEEVLPDLETILLERAKRHKTETAPPTTSQSADTKKIVNKVDIDWLSRRDGTSSAMQTRASVANASLQLSLNILDNSLATVESENSAVSNSEDESTIDQSSQSRRSIRHVIKRQRIETPSPLATTPPKKSPPRKRTPLPKKKSSPEVEVRRSTRNKSKKTMPLLKDSDDEPELFGEISDDDPTYKSEEVKEPKPKTRELKTPQPRLGWIKPPKNVKEKTESVNESQEFTDYVLEFGIERLENVPRVNVKELRESEAIVEKFVHEIPSQNPSTKSAIVPEVVNKDRAKLEKRIADGTLNENYRTIDIRKKVFVKGKKNFNFSRYKKSEWKKKKAAALCGPEMDMGGCDGGILKCYLCDGIGHMARQCKQRGDSLLPLEADEPSPFPTLDEAKEMVSGRTTTTTVPRPSTIADADADSDEEMSQISLGHEIPKDFLLKSGILERTAAKDTIDPIYRPDIETPAEVYDALRMFGHENFRFGQEQAIMRILSGKSTLVTLSTGSGKSLCYQIPAYLYKKHRKCITLVISPLVSLMEDQVTGVPKFLNAQCLHTNQTEKQREKIMLMVKEEKVDILLVSPEAVVAGEKATGFGALLRRLPPIAFACIDEAHCVSQWSHNFRPSYLSICRVLKEKLKVQTILGLTATATKSTRLSIVDHINVPDGESGIISDIPLPDNLFLTVSKDSARDNALVELISSERFRDCNSIIVYCTRREECERIAKFIRTVLQSSTVPADSSKRKRVSWIAEPYHAGMPASRRRTIQNAFMSGSLRIVVATVAFGMGINKADIRAVIHYNMPKSFESYVQEIGRAGRDGKPAHCHVFLDSRGGDRNELRRHIYANSIDRHAIRKLIQKIFVPCACQKDENECAPDPPNRTCPGHEVCFSIDSTVQLLDVPEENIATLLCYLELHDQRYIQVLSRAYTQCKIFSYGGTQELRAAAKICPPLAMAIALDVKRGVSHDTSTTIEFNVVEVASAIGWDSGVVKYQLKQLEWTTANGGASRRSKLTVQFNELGFRVRAPGDMTDDELDASLELLHERVTRQEKTELRQLQVVFDALSNVAFNSYLQPADKDCSVESSENLKKVIREYFSDELMDDTDMEMDVATDEVPDEQLIGDIRTMIQLYPENNFNGRAIARIFHGVASPNYPAVIWGRCKYWRTYMNADFNKIIKLANAELVRMRL